MRFSCAAVFLTASLASGCVGLSSVDGDADGIVYHLPKTLLEITVRQYTQLTGDGALDRVWYSLGGPDNDFNAKGVVTSLNDADHDPQLAPLSRIKPHVMPDTEHRYTIKYHPSAFSDDRLCISRQKDGLLNDVQFVADDRTSEVVFNIARFIAGFIGDGKKKTASTAFFRGAQSPKKGTPKILMRSYTNKVDPFNPTDVHTFNNALEEIFGDEVKIDFSKMRRIIARAMEIPADSCDGNGCPPADFARRCDEDNICYRTKLSLPVHLKLDDHRIDVKYADIINAWDIGAISVTRAFLVQKITKLRFEQGALVSAVIRKPSEVEEASLLPVNIMNAILTVPNGLLQSAFTDYATKARVIDDLNNAKGDLKKFQENYDNLLLEGSEAIGVADSKGKTVEHLQLNCTSGKRSGHINILGPGTGAIVPDFQ